MEEAYFLKYHITDSCMIIEYHHSVMRKCKQNGARGPGLYHILFLNAAGTYMYHAHLIWEGLRLHAIEFLDMSHAYYLHFVYTSFKVCAINVEI